MATSSSRPLARERGPFRLLGLEPEAEDTSLHEEPAYEEPAYEAATYEDPVGEADDEEADETIEHAAERDDEDEWAESGEDTNEADEVEAADEVAPHHVTKHRRAHAAPSVTAKDLMRRWDLATNVPEFPHFHELVAHWAGEVGAGYMPVPFLVAFSAHETARGFADQTAGKMNGKGVYEPAYYELGVFQVPAGLHGRGTGTRHPPPGKENGNAWFRFCALFHRDPRDWKDPDAQTQIGIANLARDAAKVRSAFPELFGDPGSDWALRAAVLLPFGPGAGYTHDVLHHHRKTLAGLPEEARWAHLQRHHVKTANPDGKMALYARLVALLGANGAAANEAEDAYEADEIDEEGEPDARYESGDAGEFEDTEAFDASEDEDESEDERTDDAEEWDDESDARAEVDFENQIAAATIESNLASLGVTTTTVVFHDAPNAFDLNAIAGINTNAKLNAFLPAQKAYSRLLAIQPPHGAAYEAARADVRTKAQAILPFLRDHGLAYNRSLATLRALHKANTKALAAAKRRAHPNAARIRALEANDTAVRGIITTSTAALTLAIKAFRPQVDFTRNVFTIDVGGVIVRLHDHVLTYASDTPAGMEGKADGDDAAGVRTALAAAGLSPDTQSVLRIVSGNEGTFTTMNTWDRGVVTFGFIQWTFQEDGKGTLTELLAAIKSDHPAIFRDHYEAYGIDVDQATLVVTPAHGGALRGGAAARYVQTNPKLVAVLSAAGTVAEVQGVQIAIAVRRKITELRAAHVSVGKNRARIGDIVGSTFGVGLLADVAVHFGEAGARRAVTKGLARFLASEPAADLTLAATRARAETFVVRALKRDPDRDAHFAALDHAPGSFTP